MPRVSHLATLLALSLLSACQSQPASGINQYICPNGSLAQASLNADQSSMRLSLGGNARTLRFDTKLQAYSNGRISATVDENSLRVTQPGSQLNCRLQIAASPASKETTAVNTVSLQGHIVYRQRIALSPQVEVIVRLEDVSRADAPATVIAETRISPAGQVPIAFNLPYDRARIETSHRYDLRVRIEESGKLLFINTQSYPLPENGSGPMEIRVDAVAP
jgi:uncharacterized lipoprotein YbaY